MTFAMPMNEMDFKPASSSNVALAFAFPLQLQSVLKPAGLFNAKKVPAPRVNRVVLLFADRPDEACRWSSRESRRAWEAEDVPRAEPRREIRLLTGADNLDID